MESQVIWVLCLFAVLWVVGMVICGREDRRYGPEIDRNIRAAEPLPRTRTTIREGKVTRIRYVTDREAKIHNGAQTLLDRGRVFELKPVAKLTVTRVGGKRAKATAPDPASS